MNEVTILNQTQQKTDVVLSSQERRTILDDKVRTMILRGASRQKCLDFISTESKRLGYQNADGQCSNIYHQVKTTLKQEFSEHIDEINADLLSKLYYLYGKNIEKDDLRECRECLRDIAKLVGTNNNVEINRGDEKIMINFS